MRESIFFDVVSKYRQQWVLETYNVELNSDNSNEKIFENWANYAIGKINFDMDLSTDENVVEFRRKIVDVFSNCYGGTIQWFPHSEHMIGVRLTFPSKDSLAAFVLQWHP